MMRGDRTVRTAGKSERRIAVRRLMSVTVALLILSVSGPSLRAEADTTILTIESVRERVLEANRRVLSAREEVRKAQADIVTARAGAFPNIRLSSRYQRNFSIAPVYFEANGEIQQLKFGFENTFGASISLRQPIWKGGKVFTAYKIAKQYHKYSQLGADQVGAASMYQGEVLFYQVILDNARLKVLRQALKTAEKNLEVVEAHYQQGMVSKFELMRAKVERSNILPKILAAESEVRLSRKRLQSFLNLDLDQPVILLEPEDDTLTGNLPPLDDLIDTALVSRREMQQSDLMVEMTRRAIRVAKAGYYPSLEAVSDFSWQSQADEFTIGKNEATSFTAGLVLSFPLFDGGVTRGTVGKMKAEHRQSQINQEELADQIRLEVEQAYDRLIQARETIEIHQENIAQAEEGLRIAELRYKAGEGTLLEILSAQTALTDARTAMAEARFMLRTSEAGLKLAGNIDKIGN